MSDSVVLSCLLWIHVAALVAWILLGVWDEMRDRMVYVVVSLLIALWFRRRD